MKFTSTASVVEEIIPFLLYSVEISTRLHGTKVIMCAVAPEFNFASFRGNKITLFNGETVTINMDNNSEYGVIISR